MSKRVVFNTFGSLGDLHPYLAVAAGLRARGHRVVIATMNAYRRHIEGAGIEFAPVRPHVALDDTVLVRRLMNGAAGPHYLFRQLLMPALRGTYQDLAHAAEGADILITHNSTYTGPLLAAKRGLRWISSVLSPLAFFSAYDPLVVGRSVTPLLAHVATLGPAPNRAAIGLIKAASRPWVRDVDRLRAELGLPPGPHPIFDGPHSPQRVLALFSTAFAAPRPDWPQHTRVTGFAFYRDEGALDPALARFLDDDDRPPVVFTLGSAAVHSAGAFYATAAAVARKLQLRAALLVGPNRENLTGVSLPESVAAFGYVPYASFFHRARAIVHSGGIGTTAHALRAGRPMLVVPHGYDQPDTAARVQRLGAGRFIHAHKFDVPSAARALREVLDEPRYAARAAEIGSQIRAEHGVENACDAIEEVLAS